MSMNPKYITVELGQDSDIRKRPYKRDESKNVNIATQSMTGIPTSAFTSTMSFERDWKRQEILSLC